MEPAGLDARSRQVLDAVFDIGETFTRSLHVEPVLERIIASLIGLTQADAGSVMLVTDDGSELVVAAAIGPRADLILGKRQPVSASLAGRALRERGPMTFDGRMEAVSDFPRDISRSLLLPLRVAGRLVGVLNLSCDSDPTPLGPGEIGLLHLLANQAAMVIENARLYEELDRRERRLELFVDRMLRTQATEKRAVGPSEAELESLLTNVMHRTLQRFTEATRTLPGETSSIAAAALTAREHEVLGLLVEGLTNKEIAARLHIKTGTVKNHVLQVMNKLGASDRTQAAVIAIRTGLLT